MSCGSCETSSKSPQEGELIGKVTHYFDKAQVVVIELLGELRLGDNIRFVGGETDFTQPIESMEIEHQKIQTAKKGDSVGLKVSQKAHEGYKVYKL